MTRSDLNVGDRLLADTKAFDERLGMHIAAMIAFEHIFDEQLPVRGMSDHVVVGQRPHRPAQLF